MSDIIANLNWLDYIILIIILLSGLLGFIKGFFKTFLSLLFGIANFLVVYYLTIPLSIKLRFLDIYSSFNENIQVTITGVLLFIVVWLIGFIVILIFDSIKKKKVLLFSRFLGVVINLIKTTIIISTILLLLSSLPIVINSTIWKETSIPNILKHKFNTIKENDNNKIEPSIDYINKQLNTYSDMINK